MILPSFVLPERGKQFQLTSGMDSEKSCLDPKHFYSYPYSVSYQFNSRGFRDNEWPADIHNSIWCFGDSFTVGLGSPIEHTWCNILQLESKTRCINVSMDGASNDWITRRVIEVLETISPKTMVIHWSFYFRHEDPDESKSDIERRVSHRVLPLDEEITRFFKLIDSIERANKHTNIIYSTIPGGTIFAAQKTWDTLKGTSWPDTYPDTLEKFNALHMDIINELVRFNKYEDFLSNLGSATKTISALISDSSSQYTIQVNNVRFIPEFEKLDLARDGFHYDKLTAKYFVDQILQLI